MIDTDKYEGHDNWDGIKINMNNEANVQLIASWSTTNHYYIIVCH